VNFKLNERAKTSKVLETFEVYVEDDRLFKIFNWIRIFYFSMLVSLMVSCSSIQTKQQTNADFFESFESKGSVKQNFRLDKIERKGWELTSEEKTHGNYGLKITLNEGDKSKNKTERAEFQDPEKLDLDQEVWYRLDFKIPEDFPDVDKRTVFWQLKQDGGNNPLVSMRFRNGELSIKQRFSFQQIKYSSLKKLSNVKNVWKRLVLQTYISTSNRGFINIYLDDKLIVSYRGQTAYASQPKKTYFKFGLYRDQTELPMHIYFDNYIRGQSWEEVVPEGGIVIPDKSVLWSNQIKELESE
jgi:hypothetical protein